MSNVSNASRHASLEINGLLGKRRKSGRWLGEQIGRSANYVSVRLRYEGEWQLGEVIAIAKVLNVPVTDLIGWE